MKFKEEFFDKFRYLSITIALIASITGIVSLFDLSKINLNKNNSEFGDLIIQINEIKTAQSSISEENKSIKAYINKIMETPLDTNAKEIANKINLLNIKNSQTENRIKLLEDAIQNSPDKALSIPLLRNDIISLKENNLINITNIRNDINRVYDMNKWFLGLIITMTLAVVSMAISTLIKTRKEEH